MERNQPSYNYALTASQENYVSILNSNTAYIPENRRDQVTVSLHIHILMTHDLLMTSDSRFPHELAITHD